MHRHDLDLVSLTFGVAFVAIGLLTLSGRTALWELRWEWVWPLLLIVVGLSTLLSARSRRE